jgi:mannose-binding lectin 2
MQNRWFDYGGDAVIRTDKYVRLTGDIGSRAGWVFSRVPLTATNWEIEVEFKISGTGTLYGDGMAMWLTKQRAQGGNVFGFQDKFDGLGVFIDTYKNNRPGIVFPYVMAMLGDGQTVYDKENDGKANELAGCSVRISFSFLSPRCGRRDQSWHGNIQARGIRNAQLPTKLRLTYFQDKSLTLDLQYKSEEKWENCFTLGDVKIPSVAYLGFSAETGELADNHDIISVSTKNLYAQSGQGSTGASAEKGKKGRKSSMKPSSSSLPPARGGGGWLWFFTKFIIFGFVLTGAYVGFTAYRTQRMRSRF